MNAIKNINIDGVNYNISNSESEFQFLGTINFTNKILTLPESFKILYILLYMPNRMEDNYHETPIICLYNALTDYDDTYRTSSMNILTTGLNNEGFYYLTGSVRVSKTKVQYDWVRQAHPTWGENTEEYGFKIYVKY